MRGIGETELACYDPVARSVHWAIAILAVIAVSLGLAIPESPRNTGSRDLLMLLHRSLGLTILAIMLFRAAWRLRHPPPLLPGNMARIEVVLAHATHWGLYFIFLVMPLTGYVNAAAAGHPVSFFGLFAIPALLPENQRLAQLAIAAHLAGQFFVYALVAAHIGAALMHRLIRRDEVWARMLPRRF